MAKTLLQIGQAVENELGLPASTSFVGNTSDLFAVQILSLANEAGEEIRDYPEGGWNSMKSETTIFVVPPVALTGNITQNSNVITNILPNTTGLTVAGGGAGAGSYAISGNAIPQASRIKSIDSTSQVTMTMEATATTTSDAILFAQDTYALPSDFKAYQNRTFWDRNNHWEIIGPSSPQMDQWHKSGIVATGPRRWFRQLGHLSNTFQIWPPPIELVNPLQISFEYFSTDWVAIGGSTTSTSSAFTTDADTTYIDDRLLIKWIKWKYQQAKGFAFDVFRNDAIDFGKTLIARDGAAETLYLAKRIHSMFLSPSQVIDGNYPGPIGPNSS